MVDGNVSHSPEFTLFTLGVDEVSRVVSIYFFPSIGFLSFYSTVMFTSSVVIVYLNQWGLIRRMVAQKLDGDLIEWTEDILTNRTLQMTVDSFDGQVSEISTGIPQ
jgi:hypothetical protein